MDWCVIFAHFSHSHSWKLTACLRYFHMLRYLGYRGDLLAKYGSYRKLIEHTVQRTRMVLIFRDLRPSTLRMSNPHHLHSTRTGDPCPSTAILFFSSRSYPSRAPSCPSTTGGLIAQDVRQRLESRAPVKYCEKGHIVPRPFIVSKAFCTTLAGCQHVCEFTRACVFVHHEVSAGLGHIPPSSGVETKTAGVDTNGVLAQMRFGIP